MSNSGFTEDEKQLLAQYQVLSASVPSLGVRLAAEVIPPLVFIGMWYDSGEVLYLLASITAMVAYGVLRIVKQYKNIARLNSISEKVLGTQPESNES
ncbi:MAG: hypothetical protein K0S46_2439 [Moraxellaceae bacterium]|nr:hypothetical protein [Moraxellaceae bacterium]